ncbi:helix-turn-helix domain-containing protein [Dermacoccus sp. 147Ba]|uniref:helix-turn-helix transcriptional regulator n=1 Tax=Dermacoccus sp. 147Ba TaxID=2510111 RepID=UPI00101C00B1|nr:helix-turn-helix domain-containing protein [Dermacoccus sp. 147Ba]RYI20432.1 helix-turn-helix domain-containing protein [Dermacoccus sp. 147Ba]
MGSTMLTQAEAAQLAGVSVSSWSSYVSRGQAPAAARHVGRTPLWRRDVVDEWRKNRPGQGRRNTERERERLAERGLDRAQAAQLAGLSVSAFSAAVRRGAAPQPAGTRGRAHVWRPEDVKRWVNARNEQGGSA